MKLKTIALFSGIIFSTISNAAVLSHYDNDKSLLITTSNPLGVNVQYKFDKESSLTKEPTTYNLKVYKVKSTNSLIDTTGVYNDDSSLLKINGKLLLQSKTIGNPVGNINSGSETSYIKSVSIKTNDSFSETTVIPEVVNSGFNLTAFPKGKNIYSVNLEQSILEKLKTFSVDDYTIQMPNINAWNYSSTIYIPEGKTAIINSPKYKIDGEQYRNVYLLSIIK